MNMNFSRSQKRLGEKNKTENEEMTRKSKQVFSVRVWVAEFKIWKMT